LVNKLAIYLSKKYNIPVITPFNINRRWPQIGKTVYPGPEEWLSLIKKAKFVITNTFHGTIFSILFKKEFIATELPSNKKNYSDRLKNILKDLSLYNRYINNFNIIEIEKILNKRIEWNIVKKRTNFLKKKGKKFLKEINV